MRPPWSGHSHRYAATSASMDLLGLQQADRLFTSFALLREGNLPRVGLARKLVPGTGSW